MRCCGPYFADAPAQWASVARLAETVGTGLLAPAVEGLAHAVDGGRFDASGAIPGRRAARLLGWTTSTHWLLDPVGAGAARPRR